jgi:hypothetical protein
MDTKAASCLGWCPSRTVQLAWVGNVAQRMGSRARPCVYLVASLGHGGGAWGTPVTRVTPVTRQKGTPLTLERMRDMFLWVTG